MRWWTTASFRNEEWTRRTRAARREGFFRSLLGFGFGRAPRQVARIVFVPSYDLTPRDVTPVDTRLRQIRTQLPVPESVPLLERLQAAEPVAMRGQPPVLWDSAEGFLVRDAWGNQWIDWSSGVLITNAGHGDRRIIDAIRGVKNLIFSNPLEAMAKATGAVDYSPRTTGGLHESISDIGADLRSQYLLSYTPSDLNVGGIFHHLRVEVPYKGAKVRARPGYFHGPRPVVEGDPVRDVDVARKRR